MWKVRARPPIYMRGTCMEAYDVFEYTQRTNSNKQYMFEYTRAWL